MQGFFELLILFLFLGAGAVCARLRLAPKPAKLEQIIRIVLWVLLFGMGFRIGNNRDSLQSICHDGRVGVVYRGAFDHVGSAALRRFLQVCGTRDAKTSSQYGSEIR